MKSAKRSSLACVAAALAGVALPARAQVLGDVIDVAQDFHRLDAVYFVASRVSRFDVASGRGTLQWERYTRSPSFNFEKIDQGFSRAGATEFPGTEYDRD